MNVLLSFLNTISDTSWCGGAVNQVSQVDVSLSSIRISFLLQRKESVLYCKGANEMVKGKYIKQLKEYFNVGMNSFELHKATVVRHTFIDS